MRLLEDGVVLAQVGKMFVIHSVLKRLRMVEGCGSFHCVLLECCCGDGGSGENVAMVVGENIAVGDYGCG